MARGSHSLFEHSGTQQASCIFCHPLSRLPTLLPESSLFPSPRGISHDSFMFSCSTHFLSPHSVSGDLGPIPHLCLLAELTALVQAPGPPSTCLATHNWPLTGEEVGGQAWRPGRAQTRHGIPDELCHPELSHPHRICGQPSSSELCWPALSREQSISRGMQSRTGAPEEPAPALP